MGPWEWWNDSDIRRELGLSPDKVQKIQDIYTTRSQLLKPTIDDFTKELAALDALTKARTVDEGTFAAQVNKVEYLRSKIGESRTVMLYRMSLVLSPDQYRKLQDIRNRRDRDRERERGSQPK
jgi:Spy/CpxP family protein refolding chaperone